ncbi:hypothetical protein INR49_014743 [Caranx melampygus]|nr:hypothetical protein INR49_014743 [Caranx melampygus]
MKQLDGQRPNSWQIHQQALCRAPSQGAVVCSGSMDQSRFIWALCFIQQVNSLLVKFRGLPLVWGGGRVENGEKLKRCTHRMSRLIGRRHHHTITDGQSQKEVSDVDEHVSDHAAAEDTGPGLDVIGQLVVVVLRLSSERNILHSCGRQHQEDGNQRDFWLEGLHHRDKVENSKEDEVDVGYTFTAEVAVSPTSCSLVLTEGHSPTEDLRHVAVDLLVKQIPPVVLQSVFDGDNSEHHHQRDHASYSCWWGPYRANTVLLVPLDLCLEVWASRELLVGRPSAGEYQPRPGSSAKSARQRCRTQWSCSIYTAGLYGHLEDRVCAAVAQQISQLKPGPEERCFDHHG